jgi:hypothetical protein
MRSILKQVSDIVESWRLFEIPGSTGRWPRACGVAGWLGRQLSRSDRVAL